MNRLQYPMQGETEVELAGADAAERDADDALNPGDYEEVSDFELLEDGDEEEETQLLGGGGFTPEQLAAAEAHFQAEMVTHVNTLHQSGCISSSDLYSCGARRLYSSATGRRASARPTPRPRW